MRRHPITVLRLLVIYLLGLMAGAQSGLYLYDRFDDGVSEPLSGVIALAFVVAGAAAIVLTVRSPRGAAAP